MRTVSLRHDIRSYSGKCRLLQAYGSGHGTALHASSWLKWGRGAGDEKVVANCKWSIPGGLYSKETGPVQLIKNRNKTLAKKQDQEESHSLIYQLSSPFHVWPFHTLVTTLVHAFLIIH